jgi:hypothetical protein
VRATLGQDEAGRTEQHFLHFRRIHVGIRGRPHRRMVGMKINEGLYDRGGPEIRGNAQQTRIQPNDIVIFTDKLGMWKVVAPVNGSKADIRRKGSSDTRIITARLESLTFIRRAGTPEYGY